MLKTEMGAGHGGPSGRYDAWKEEALVYAFLLDAFGLAEGAEQRPTLPFGYVVAVVEAAGWKWSVNGAWLPGGNVTAAPSTVAENEAGRAGDDGDRSRGRERVRLACCNVVVKRTAPVDVSVASTQH